MAENKKGFILYADYIDVFEELSDVNAGQLIKHIFKYVNDKNPVTDNPIVKITFISIRNQLKRDLKEWEEKRHGRSEAGKRGMASRWNKHKPAITKDNTVINPITKITVTDTVTDIVTVTDTVKREGGKKFTPPAKEDVFNEMILKIDDFTAHGESEKFCDFYNSKGWMVGKNKMKDWKSAVRNWIRGMNKFEKNGKTGTSTARVDALKNW